MAPELLAGVRVLVTRPADQAEAWRRALEAEGASPVLHPTIEVSPPASWAPLDAALDRIAEYDWLVFTSANAARFAGPRILARLPARRPKCAAVGQRTASALAEAGMRVDLVPANARQEGLVEALSGMLSAGSRVLFPQSLSGLDHLPNALRARGVEVDVVPASETRSVEPLPPLPLFDVATFGSPSALHAFVAGHGLSPLRCTPTVVIGPTTAATAESLGLSPRVASSPAVDALIAAIAAALSRKGDT